VCTTSGGSPSWPPLRSALVLAAPLDPLLGAALSLGGATHSPTCGAKTATGSGAGEGAELPYFGFWFAEGFEVLDPPMPASLDDVEAAPDAWVVRRVWRELQGSGAHRQLVTRVTLERRAAASSAGGRGAGWVALVEALPSGVYADKFELHRMAHHAGEALTGWVADRRLAGGWRERGSLVGCRFPLPRGSPPLPPPQTIAAGQVVTMAISVGQERKAPAKRCSGRNKHCLSDPPCAILAASGSSRPVPRLVVQWWTRGAGRLLPAVLLR
jgi:hypothetical protein